MFVVQMVRSVTDGVKSGRGRPLPERHSGLVSSMGRKAAYFPRVGRKAAYFPRVGRNKAYFCPVPGLLSGLL